MKYIDEYRDARIARGLAKAIADCARHNWVLMEICGGQTHTIMRYGLDELLPRQIELVHGPGCPVCVTPLETIDKAIALALRPGSDPGVLRRHVARARVRSWTCFVPRQEVRMYESFTHPPERLLSPARIPLAKSCFLPSVSKPRPQPTPWPPGKPGVKRLTNFSMLVSHVLVPPAMRALLASPQNRVQGFDCPRPRVHRHGLSGVRGSGARLCLADRGGWL